MEPEPAFALGVFIGSAVTAVVVGGLARSGQDAAVKRAFDAGRQYRDFETETHGRPLDGDPDTQLGIRPR